VAPRRSVQLATWLGVVFLVYVVLLAVSTIGAGFKLATAGEAKALFELASNPISGLLIGLLATALLQSSSTVTAIIVGLVAGGLPVHLAVPMIMGANMGTTITNTLVSLGHVSNKEEFRRAFAAATVHDFFNLFCVLVFLPIEILFSPLEKAASWSATWLVGGDSLSLKSFNFIKPLTKPVVELIAEPFTSMSATIGGVLLILIGISLIVLAITLLSRLLKRVLVGRAERILHNAIGRGPLTGIATGTVVTVLVQSSSTTTSLIVPLAGSGILSVRDIFPFTLGANIGTTVTALLAATAVTGDNAVFALQIALVHLFFNIGGVLLIYSTKFTRELPPRCAIALSQQATRHPLWVAAYVMGVFFALPAGLLYITT
jgi:sodium-dependent phosphate cotransporter